MDNQINTRLLFKVIYILKRLTDEWGEQAFTALMPEFKMGYIPVFMSIGTKGISNNELAKELKITKMAASKTIKELHALELITSQKDPLDARSERIFLTDKGMEFSAKINMSADSMVSVYRDLVGEKKYETTIDVLLSITRHHEEINAGR